MDRRRNGDCIAQEPARQNCDNVRPICDGAASAKQDMVRVVTQMRDGRAVFNPIPEGTMTRRDRAGLS